MNPPKPTGPLYIWRRRCVVHRKAITFTPAFAPLTGPLVGRHLPYFDAVLHPMLHGGPPWRFDDRRWVVSDRETGALIYGPANTPWAMLRQLQQLARRVRRKGGSFRQSLQRERNLFRQQLASLAITGETQ